MIPKRRKAQPMGLREETVIRSKGHLQWLRGCECSVPSCEYKISRVEAAHVRIGTDGSMGKKPGDNWAIPLCYFHHRKQHTMGEASFEEKYGIRMKKIAEALWQKSPHRKKFTEPHP
jgi:hypothetical protein